VTVRNLREGAVAACASEAYGLGCSGSSGRRAGRPAPGRGASALGQAAGPRARSLWYQPGADRHGLIWARAGAAGARWMLAAPCASWRPTRRGSAGAGTASSCARCRGLGTTPASPAALRIRRRGWRSTAHRPRSRQFSGSRGEPSAPVAIPSAPSALTSTSTSPVYSARRTARSASRRASAGGPTR
jgi:hypothetical protein